MLTRRSWIQALVAQAAPRGGPAIGLATGTYGMKALPAADALRAIARIGYDGVELCLMPGWPTDPAALTPSSRRELRGLLAETGLAVPSLIENLPLLGGTENQARALERLRLAIDLAHELAPANPPVVETVAGGKASEWELVREQMAEQLRAWSGVAEAWRTTVCFKPHASNAVNSVERALWLAHQVDSRRIRIVYDYSHFAVEGYGLEDSLRQLLPITAFIAVKDSEGKPPRHRYLLPGDGSTDYPEYFRLLRELGYAGYVGVEVSSQLHQQPGYRPVETARLCYERLARWMAQAGVTRPSGRRG